jgi:cell fate (sporulation/competence/biofilm development) regulator YlbF (YheA/YmcA/DUF963 family)
VADAWRLRRVPRLEAALHKLDRQDQVLQGIEAGIQRLHDNASVAGLMVKIEAEQLRSEDRQEFDRLQQDLKKAKVSSQEPTLIVIRVLEKYVRQLDNLSRREETLTKSMLRGLHELERLKRLRAGEEVAAPAVVDVAVHVDRDSGEKS